MVLQLSATKSHGSHQNAKKLTGNTKKDEIWILKLNIIWMAAGKQSTQKPFRWQTSSLTKQFAGKMKRLQQRRQVHSSDKLLAEGLVSESSCQRIVLQQIVSSAKCR